MHSLTEKIKSLTAMEKMTILTKKNISLRNEFDCSWLEPIIANATDEESHV